MPQYVKGHYHFHLKRLKELLVMQQPPSLYENVATQYMTQWQMCNKQVYHVGHS